MRVNNVTRPSPASSQSSLTAALANDEEEKDKSAVDANKNKDKDPDEDTLSKILSAVRLSLMSTPDLLRVVRPTQLVPPDVMLDAIQSKTESRDMELNYRGYLSEKSKKPILF